MPQDPVISSGNLIPGITFPSAVIQTPTFTPKMTTLAAAVTLTTGQSGTIFLLNLAGGFTVTLPVLTFGLFYRFVAKTAPTTAYIIASNEASKIVGAAFGADGGAQDSQTTLGASSIQFKANVAVIGDSCDLWCDGAAWYGRAYCAAAGGCTYTG